MGTNVPGVEPILNNKKCSQMGISKALAALGFGAWNELETGKFMISTCQIDIVHKYDVKCVVFKGVWGYVKVLPDPYPCKGSLLFLKPFKWGNLWRFSPRGIKTTKS